jgi:hypothetical protein
MVKAKAMELQKRFPNVLKNLYGRVDQTCMAFGIECGSGWDDLIENTLEQLEAVNQDVVIDQIKEKFGTLRIYFSGGGKEAEDIVGVAERQSALICESCGADGILTRNRHWLMTACDKCKG